MTKPSTPDWNEFLRRLAHGIEHFAERVGRSGPNQSPVRHDPGGSRDHAGEIQIGIRCDPQSARAICLNNKAGPRQWTSLTRYLTQTELTELDGWQFPGDGADPIIGVFEHATLVVEDVSPDSCFALVCLLARKSGLAADDIPGHWITYIDRWEMGDVTTTGDNANSYGALHNVTV